MVYVEELGQHVPEDQVQPGQHCLRISGTEQRRRLAQGEELPAWFTPPEVAAELRRAFPARSARGVGVLVRAALPDPHDAAAAVAARLREAGRTVTVLDGAAPEGATAASPLVVHLVGEIMRNGGVVVCSGEAAHCLAEARARLARCGLVLDVHDTGEPVSPADVPTATEGVARLEVPPDAGSEAVGDAVWHHLRASGHVAAGFVPLTGREGASTVPQEPRVPRLR
jgi:hypothetical protein